MDLWRRPKAKRTQIEPTSAGRYPAWQGEEQDPVTGKTNAKGAAYIYSERRKREENNVHPFSLRGNGVKVSPQVRAGCRGGVRV